ncbi:PREDICTED: uncharacterized protein LOC109235483 [Nicotiana attenuata]|uniref:uncharacterized protein LOC109235483 n=1 Tax=Nicotiana attenuata TaxID=49451 RepID=UPI00090494AB|nr:PREDICTED: uncharacterized protein LOC109235483 [Nicotiana attenuata]
MRSRGQSPLPTWEEYIWALCDTFGAEYTDPMTEIMNIKHTGTVKDYQRSFTNVMTRLNIAVEHAINIFLNNLKPELSNAAKRQLFSLELEAGEVLIEEEEEEQIEGEGEEIATELPENCAISLQALNGTLGYQTLRLRGFTEQKPLEIFIDCGSTHNFIDEGTATRLGCPISKTKPQLVQVADGREVPTYSICKGFKWLMQGAVFPDDFLVFPIGKSDIVLGIQWLYPLEDIKFNFRKLMMEFEYKGQLLTLQGIQPKFKTVLPRAISKMTIEGSQFFMVKVREVECKEVNVTELEEGEGSKELKVVLAEYAGIFGEPTQLPPSRGVFDHHIPLKEGMILEAYRNSLEERRVKIGCQHRYSPVQKDVIETMVKEMMDQGIIQYSSSPYASPVVLVSKKDGSWRLCVDYRALNKMTIKDKFPIPIIEELLDELGGSQIYSKIDLKAGKFIVVFFDDILVYSSSLEEHLQHLRLVFGLLLQHQLLAKKSKCVFVAQRVEYLGHYISAQGVSTDPRKIEAVQSWPEPQSVTQLRGFLGLTGYYSRFIRGYGVKQTSH